VFAGAAREAVFSNAKVVRRINAQFIPVALKAGLVNNPPAGLEGTLYAEIGRSKPAPQGICVVNSAGKVLDWVLMFDDNESILKFFDHVLERYAKFPDAKKPLPAERFMRFPSRKLADIQDTTGALKITDRHIDEKCPAKPIVRKGTLVGRVIGRALDKQGKPVADTLRQEHYMEARFEVPPNVQRSLAAAVIRAGAKRFRIPDDFVRSLVSPAFLGQLDVNPLGGVPGSKNDSRKWEFWGQRVGSEDSQPFQVRFEGKSDVAGGQSRVGFRSDGRMWEHEVNLTWEGYVDIDTKERCLKRLVAVALGNEKLRWGNKRLTLIDEPDVAHLPAGHPIDLKCGVRYGLVAEPYVDHEALEGATNDGRKQPQR